MASYLFIVNPVAGAGRGRELVKIILSSHYRAYHSITLRLTEFQGHAYKITVEEGSQYDFMVICGGDGTINEVINGLIPHSKAKIGIIPIGSGNDLAKSLKIKAGFKKNLDLIFDRHSLIEVNIAKAEIKEYNSDATITRRFVNSMGVGFDAQVAKIKNNIELRFSFLKYIAAIAIALSDYKAIDVTVSTNKFRMSGKKLFVTIGNGKASGGGLYLTPDAKLDDDKLDISIIDFVSRLILIMKFPLALIKKTKKIKQVYSDVLKNAQINLKEPEILHLDGEVISNKLVETKVTLLDYKISMIINPD